MSALPKSQKVWKLAEAKNKLSEVVNRTISEGRQEIHRRDDVVVMISKEELEEIEGRKEHPDLIEHLLAIPKDEPDSGEPTLTEIILEGRRWFKDYDK